MFGCDYQISGYTVKFFIPANKVWPSRSGLVGAVALLPCSTVSVSRLGHPNP